MTNHRTLRRSATATAVITAAALLSLAACTVTAPPPAEEGPREVLESFLDALSEGSFAEAVALTTATSTDIECEWMRVSGPPAASAPEIISIDDGQDDATAGVEFGSPAGSTQDFALVRVDGQWRVQLPESYRLKVEFDEPVVADVTVTDRLTDTMCTFPVRGGSLELFAWPGRYALTIIDPSGLLRDRLTDTVIVQEKPGMLSLEAVTPLDLSDVQSQLAPLITAAFEECVDGGFESVTCAPDLRAASGSALTSEPTGAYSLVTRVWTEDDRTWRFEATPAAIVVTDAAGERTVPFTYAGAIVTSESGTLSIEPR